MVVVIDNYDSFVYNLVQYIKEYCRDIKVYRNDRVSIKEIKALGPSHIVISPGPCTPNEAGVSLKVIECFAHCVPILGVCLGHQAIGQAFGGRVIRAPRPVHGKTDLVFHDRKTVYRNLPSPLPAARYHSLVVERSSLPSCLEITASTRDGLIMGLRHKEFKVEGLQFHPESILTRCGREIISNFIRGGDVLNGHSAHY